MSSNSPSVSPPTWEELFPYPEPYDQQREAIEKVGETASNDGFSLLEGACGTGKTLIALTAGLEAVRDPQSKYDRVVCMTSVKQQLRAFEDDIEAINDNLPESVPEITGLSIVGKSDLCSYVDDGKIASDDIYSACESLRDQVRREANAAEDPVSRLTSIVGSWNNSGSDSLSTENWSAQYDDTDPMSDGAPTGCPFYAEHMRQSIVGPDDYAFSLSGFYRPDDLLYEASDEGICPHSAMVEALDQAEVIVGNYRHAFDETTVAAMTGALIDDSTFVVCDEAHSMISIVRDLLTEECSGYTFDQTIRELDEFILNPSNSEHRTASSIILEEIATSLDVEKQEARQLTAKVLNIAQDVNDKLYEYSEEAIEDEMGSNWKRYISSSQTRTIENGLQDPNQLRKDDLSKWMEQSGYDDWDDLHAATTVIAEAIREASQRAPEFSRINTFTDTFGRVMTAWHQMESDEYFREVELTRRETRLRNADTKWNEYYRTKFAMKNCIPKEGIGNVLEEFGGGILMSATLEPFDAYKREVGLDEVDRPIRELSYGLTFPEKNRESLIVDVGKFTYRNRGNPDEEMNDLRQQYADIIRSVTETTDGNVLVCMPSYREGQWASNILENTSSVEKEILLDQSTRNEVTEELKQTFFEGDAKVLITSMRGTLTEGVDYEGSKLDACVICGLPIRGMRSPHATAIETSYKQVFGDFEGFAYGFAVPALRKARQALGRVIRSDEDTGTRVMADSRYASGYLRQYMPEYERQDYRTVEPRDLRPILQSFWRRRG